VEPAIAMMVSRANGGLCWTLRDGVRSRDVFEEVRVPRTLIHECQEKAREIIQAMTPRHGFGAFFSASGTKASPAVPASAKPH
jgi:hypothetical protein